MSGDYIEPVTQTKRESDNYEHIQPMETPEHPARYESLNFTESKSTKDRSFLSSRCGRILCISMVILTAVVLAVGISSLVSWLYFNTSNHGNSIILLFMFPK